MQCDFRSNKTSKRCISARRLMSISHYEAKCNSGWTTLFKLTNTRLVWPLLTRLAREGIPNCCLDQLNCSWKLQWGNSHWQSTRTASWTESLLIVQTVRQTLQNGRLERLVFGITRTILFRTQTNQLSNLRMLISLKMLQIYNPIWNQTKAASLNESTRMWCGPDSGTQWREAQLQIHCPWARLWRVWWLRGTSQKSLSALGCEI